MKTIVTQSHHWLAVVNKHCIRLEIAKVGAMSRCADRTQNRARKMVQADNI